MNYSYDKFLRPLTTSDKTIKILDDTYSIKYTIDPFAIVNYAVISNLLRISLKSSRVITLGFSTTNEAKIALGRLQKQVDQLVLVTPFSIDKNIENYINAKIEEVGMIVGPTGATGPQGLTGSADKYSATSSTTLEVPEIGEYVILQTQTNIAYSTAQNVSVYSDLPNLYGYFIAQIDYYDTNTGEMSLVVDYSEGSGTFSFWYINLSGRPASEVINITDINITGSLLSSTSSKIGFYGVTASDQPSNIIGTASYIENLGSLINTETTFDGYTLSQVVKSLRTLGILK